MKSSLIFSFVAISIMSLTVKAGIADQEPLLFAPPVPLPTPIPHRIHPGYDHLDKCLDVKGAIFANETPVQIFGCNGTPAQNWFINRGSGRIQLAGQNFCLDAGNPPFKDGNKMKIYQCFSDLPAQKWFYTEDDRIALENQGTCLDLTDGSLADSNPIQIWKCSDGNANQVWVATL